MAPAADDPLCPPDRLRTFARTPVSEVGHAGHRPLQARRLWRDVVDLLAEGLTGPG